MGKERKKSDVAHFTASVGREGYRTWIFVAWAKSRVGVLGTGSVLTVLPRVGSMQGLWGSRRKSRDCIPQPSPPRPPGSAEALAGSAGGGTGLEAVQQQS